MNHSPSGCNLTAPYREYNLHLINIPPIAGYEKVYRTILTGIGNEGVRPRSGELCHKMAALVLKEL